MSRFRALAIERLGAPLPSWPTVYGPTAGSDPIAANGLRTLDLTPFMESMQSFTEQMERDLSKGSFSSFPLSFNDKDGSLADTLGPSSATFAASARYYSPRVQIWEDYGSPTTSIQRALGYLDPLGIEWSENTNLTRVSVLPSSQLLKERLLTDRPELLRPYPMVPTTASQSFAASTADDEMLAAAPSYTARANKVALEQTLWAQGKISWLAMLISNDESSATPHPDGSWTPTGSRVYTYPLPSAPAQSLSMSSHAFLVDHIEGDITFSVDYGTPGASYKWGTKTYQVARIVLQGAPDLTPYLTLTPTPTTILWGISETLRTHYLLVGSVAAPAGGSDGQRWMQLNTVEGLVPGDILTITYVDTTSGAQRITTADLPPIVDVDGETGKVWFSTALQQAYSTSSVSKIRRNSQDPALFDGLAYAKAITVPSSDNSLDAELDVYDIRVDY